MASLIEKIRVSIGDFSLTEADNTPERIRELVYRLNPQKDASIIFACFEELAKSGDAEALLEVGRCRWWGYGVSRYRKQALEDMVSAGRAGCVAGSQAASANLASEGDVTRSRELAELAIEQGDPGGLAHYRLGCLAEDNFEETVRYCREAASRGNLDAVFELCLCHLKGWGVEKDIEEGVRLGTQAAKSGHWRATYNLGAWHATGNYGVEQSWPDCERWYRRSSELGNPKASETLAIMYGTGEEIPMDMGRAVLYQPLAEFQSDRGMDGFLETINHGPLHHSLLIQPARALVNTLTPYFATKAEGEFSSHAIQFACLAYEVCRGRLGQSPDERWFPAEFRDELQKLRDDPEAPSCEADPDQQAAYLAQKFQDKKFNYPRMTNDLESLLEKAEEHLWNRFLNSAQTSKDWSQQRQEHSQFLADCGEAAQLKITQANGSAEVLKGEAVLHRTEAWFIGRHNGNDRTYQASWALEGLPPAMLMKPVFGEPGFLANVSSEEAWEAATRCADTKNYISVVLPQKVGEDYLFIALGTWRTVSDQGEEILFI